MSPGPHENIYVESSVLPLIWIKMTLTQFRIIRENSLFDTVICFKCHFLYVNVDTFLKNFRWNITVSSSPLRRLVKYFLFNFTFSDLWKINVHLEKTCILAYFTQLKLNVPRESGMQLAVQLSQGFITHFSLLWQFATAHEPSMLEQILGQSA